MRWEALFADLEAQLEAARATEAAADVAELTRAERATVELGARLRAGHGHVLTIRSGAARITGTVLDVAEQWVLLGDGPARWLVPAAAVTAVRGLPVHAAPAPGAVERRLSLGHALRAIATAPRCASCSTTRSSPAGSTGSGPTTWTSPCPSRTRGRSGRCRSGRCARCGRAEPARRAQR